MQRVLLSGPDDFDGWRDAARQLALAGVPAEEVDWQIKGDAPSLFALDASSPPVSAAGGFAVSRAFLELAERAILHREPERFGLLYALLLQVRRNAACIEDRADPLLKRVEGLDQAVRRDIHKMRAFLRFRELADETGSRFLAWFEPEHHIVRANAGFFVRRFASMRWSILTPEVSLHWDGDVLSEGPGASKADAPDGDPVEEMWKGYYAAIFNPARLKQRAMLSEMPRKYWRNLPEAALIPELIAGAQAREAAMIAKSHTPADSPGNSTLAWSALRQEAMGCTRCPLYRDATQTVFGEGPVNAPLMLIGEQPGDQEDLAGHPFVGPAGQLLDRALEEARIDRASLYLTNAVKHFKHERRGKRRIHQTPETPEIKACHWWLEQELDLVQPRIIVALGATAAWALLGKAVTISRTRGAPIALEGGAEAWVTVHPSFLLRVPDEDRKAAERARFVEELREIGARAGALG